MVAGNETTSAAEVGGYGAGGSFSGTPAVECQSSLLNRRYRADEKTVSLPFPHDHNFDGGGGGRGH